MAGKPQLSTTFADVARLRMHPDRLSWPAIAAQLGISRASAIRIWQAGKKKDARVKITLAS